VAGKLGPFRAVKTGLGERPKKRGFPVKLELRQSHHQDQYKTICRSPPITHNSNAYYIACAVTSNNILDLRDVAATEQKIKKATNHLKLIALDAQQTKSRPRLGTDN
jgi:hypothetical protein